MKNLKQIRWFRKDRTRTLTSLGAAVLLCCGLAGGPARAQEQRPAPIERRPPPAASAAAAPRSYDKVFARSGTAPRHQPVRGEHLAEWMNQHRTLTPQQQQQALAHEPGFTALPPKTQERMRNRLAQLDAMAPEKRQRLLARNEVMERLNPNERAEVRGAMSQLGSLPRDQRMVVARTFNQLRQLPAEQRASALNSGRFGPPLTGAQRGVLSNLLRVEPMIEPMLPRTERSPSQPAMQAPGGPGFQAPR